MSRAHKAHRVCRSVWPSAGSAAQQETGWGQLQAEPQPRLDASSARGGLGPASPAAAVHTGLRAGDRKAWAGRSLPLSAVELCPAEEEKTLQTVDSARDDNPRLGWLLSEHTVLHWKLRLPAWTRFSSPSAERKWQLLEGKL